MRLKLLFLLIIPFVILSCGESGVETDISKTTTLSYEILRDQVNANANGTYELKQTVDFAEEEFREYINDTKRFRIEKLQIELSGYDERQPSSRINDLVINVIVDGVADEFLSAKNLDVENRGKLLLYEVNNPFSVLTDDQIATLENIAGYILNKKPLEFQFEADFEGPLFSDFTVTVYFDMVASVQLD